MKQQTGEAGTMHEAKLLRIPVRAWNARHHEPDKELTDLPASIVKHSLPQPVVLRARFEH